MKKQLKILVFIFVSFYIIIFLVCLTETIFLILFFVYLKYKRHICIRFCYKSQDL